MQNLPSEARRAAARGLRQKVRSSLRKNFTEKSPQRGKARVVVRASDSGERALLSGRSEWVELEHCRDLNLTGDGSAHVESTRRLAAIMFAEIVGSPRLDQREKPLLAVWEKRNDHDVRARYVRDRCLPRG